MLTESTCQSPNFTLSKPAGRGIALKGGGKKKNKKRKQFRRNKMRPNCQVCEKSGRTMEKKKAKLSKRVKGGKKRQLKGCVL